MTLHIHKIATGAMNASNPSRSTMIDIMMKMCMDEGHVLTEHEQVLLYGFFSEKIPKTPKTDLQWVALAASKVSDDGRPYLRAIQVLNGVMTATDGHRLHQAPTDLADGFYDGKGQVVDMSDWTFPDTSRVIPPSTATPREWRRADLVAQDTTSKFGGIKTRQIYVGPGWESGFQSKLWDEALGGITEGTFLQYDMRSPARFDLEGGRLAVLMPIRI